MLHFTSSAITPRRMDLKRTLAISIGVQSLGTTATFLTIALIAAFSGPATQGAYAQTRAWVDLMIALGAFGFPSAIIYAMNRMGFGVHRLTWVANRYSLALGVPLALATFFAARGGALGEVDSTLLVVLCLGPVGAAGTLHMLWRSMYLTFDDGARFGFFTILPNLAVLGAVTATVALGQARFELAFLAAYSIAVFAAFLLLRPVLGSAERTVDERRLPVGHLTKYGLHQMLQGFLSSGQLVGLYWLIRQSGGGDADIGMMNMSIQAFFGATIPVNMVVPVLLNRWTQVDDVELISAARSVLHKGVPIAILIAPLLSIFAYYAVPGLFGESFRGAALPAAVLALAVVPGFAVRIASAAFQAAGRPEIMTWLSILRVAFGAGMYMLFARNDMDLVLAGATAWGVSESLCSFAADRGLKRIQACS